MSKRKGISGALGAVCASVCLIGLSCGGGEKHADAPGTCPEGTVLNGSDCVADRSAAGAKDDAPSAKTDEPAAAAATDKPVTKSSDSSVAGAGAGGGTYDKEAVDAQLKRAAKQIKDNCGSASDDDGNKTGPWGQTSATIVLGRNGHVSDVTVPAPYSGKPVGECVVRSFKKIQFPPYAGPSDVSVNWDIVIAQPKHK
ncbi:MAG: hypothetical protein JOZ69_18205 [Myxococcales bacterium]|nr:hypothetical protein [Myxococcales bacterium]